MFLSGFLFEKEANGDSSEQAMLLLGISLLPAGHLLEISSAYTEHRVELRVGQVLVKARRVAAGGFRAARLKSFEGELDRRGETR